MVYNLMPVILLPMAIKYQKSTSITSPNLVYFTSGGYNNVVPSLFSNNEIIGYLLLQAVAFMLELLAK